MRLLIIILIFISRITIAQKSSYIVFVRYEKELTGTYYISNDSLLRKDPLQNHTKIEVAGKSFFLYPILFSSDKENLSTWCELFLWDRFLMPLINYEKKFGSGKADSLINKYDRPANDLANFYKKVNRKQWQKMNHTNSLFYIQSCQEVEFCECNNFSDLPNTRKSMFLKSIKLASKFSLFRKKEERDLIHKIAHIDSL